MKTGHTDNAGRTLVTAATRNGRTLIGVVLNTWDDTGWSGALLDQGFTMPADSKGVGETLPPVRTVTADQRRAALVGMPSALGAAALDGSTPATATTATAPATTPTTHARTTDPTTRDTSATAPVGSRLASTSTAASSGSDSTFATIWKAAFVGAGVIGLTLFLLRRRAVRRQRARRIARMKRMDEIRRRRMIDLVEPSDELGHVRVVTPRTRSAG
jgi:D-alanyl-D-alanine carboxypeptidase